MYKYLFFGLFLILLLAGVGIGGYFFGQSQTNKKTSSLLLPQQTIVSPTTNLQPTVGEKPVEDKSLVAVTENTVSFGRKGETTVLRYRGKIYDDSNQFSMEGKPLADESSYTWYWLINAPPEVTPNEFMYDEVFGFKIGADKRQLLFIMRWGNKDTPDTLSYYLYHYNPFEKERLRLVKKFIPGENSYNIPKISEWSKDGVYLSLEMYSCWNCGGHKPETLLVNLKTNEMKRISKTSYFTWKENGNYEYKEYKMIPCVDESMGECSEKPENLPLKTGSFELSP